MSNCDCEAYFNAGMFSQFLYTARRLFERFYHPPHTMDFNWNSIIDPILYQSTSHFRQFFIQAASDSASPESILDRITVVSIRLNKNLQSPEHEYLIVETKDSKDHNVRFFLIDRIDRPGQQLAEPNSDPGQPGLGSNATSSSDSPLYLSSMEGVPPPAIPPPIPFTPHQLSFGDKITLSITKSSKSISNSLDNQMSVAFDRIQGEVAVKGPKYGCGQIAQQIRPKDMKLFELAVLADVVHNFALQYSLLDKNCFWFCSLILNSVKLLWKFEEFEQPGPDHQTEIFGRYKGIKITHTDPKEVSDIVRLFKEELKVVVNQVNFFFLLNYYSLLNSEQIATKVNGLRMNENIFLEIRNTDEYVNLLKRAEKFN